MEQPKPTTTDEVLKELTAKSVIHVVRVCHENDYDYESTFNEKNFECSAFPYEDGANPPEAIITEWLALVDKIAQQNAKGGKQHAIAIHCVAGLGRAPLLVALAYIEAGMSGVDAASMLRNKRQGCINNKQLDFLRLRKTGKGGAGCCALM